MNAAQHLRLCARRGFGFDIARYGVKLGIDRVWTANPADPNALDALLGLAQADGAVLMFLTVDGWEEV